MKSGDIRAMLNRNGADYDVLSNGKLETSAFTAFGIWEIALHLASIEELLRRTVEAADEAGMFYKPRKSRGNGVDY